MDPKKFNTAPETQSQGSPRNPQKKQSFSKSKDNADKNPSVSSFTGSSPTSPTDSSKGEWSVIQKAKSRNSNCKTISVPDSRETPNTSQEKNDKYLNRNEVSNQGRRPQLNKDTGTWYDFVKPERNTTVQLQSGLNKSVQLKNKGRPNQLLKSGDEKCVGIQREQHFNDIPMTQKNLSGKSQASSSNNILSKPPDLKRVNESRTCTIIKDKDAKTPASESVSEFYRHADTVPVGKPKKQKKSKAQRQAKRERDTLDELYKHKDSRVNLINSDVFKMLKGETCVSTPCRSTFAQPYVPDQINTSLISRSSNGSSWKDFRFNASSSVTDFPALKTAASSSKSKTCEPTSSYQDPAQLPLAPKFIEGNLSVSSPNQASWPGINDLFPSPSITTNSATNMENLTNLKADTIDSNDNSKQNKQRLSVQPLVVSLNVLLETSKAKGNTLLGKQIAKKRNDRSSAVKRENHKLTIGNLLDSSGPAAIHRGKIKNKRKKPSKLKKAILKSRELRKTNTCESEISFSETIEAVDKLAESSIDIENKNDCDTQLIPVIPEFKGFKNDPRSDATPDEIKIKQEVSNDTSLEDRPKDIFKVIMDSVEEESKPKPSVPQRIIDLVKLQMHSRKFRSYCDMFVCKEMYGFVIPLMKELHRLQDRLYKTDPIKFKTKRRYVNGLKDVSSVLKFNKAQLVILAPDMEYSKGEGGLDEKVVEIISLAREKNVPYIFAGNRYILGKCIMQTKTPVSAIAVIDKQSVEEPFNRVLEEAEILRVKYRSEFNQKINEAMSNGA